MQLSRLVLRLCPRIVSTIRLKKGIVARKRFFSHHQLRASVFFFLNCLTRWRRGRELVHCLYTQKRGYVYQPPVDENPTWKIGLKMNK